MFIPTELTVSGVLCENSTWKYPTLYIQVDLPENYVISEVLTQGRFANGQGQEYTQAYRIHYWRDGMQQFKEYRDNIGKTVNIYYHLLFINLH